MKKSRMSIINNADSVNYFPTHLTASIDVIQSFIEYLPTKAK